MVAFPTEISIVCGAEPAQKYVLPPGEYLIGSAADAPLRVTGAGIAGRHARLTLLENEWLIEVLDGAGETFVNAEPVAAARIVFPTQKIRVGAATIGLHRLRSASADSAGPVAVARQLIPDEMRGDGKYAIGPIVGRGGMGVILDAHETAAQRKVAMKLMLDCSRAGDIARFVQEAQITAQLEHPNIVPVHELGVNELDQPFYTMKFVRGVSLGEVLGQLALDDPAAVEKYPLSTLLTLFQKVCDALAFAHSRGVIHRDLKPANIMLGEYGEALVMDWGLAKMLGRELPTEGAAAAPAPRPRPAVWTTGGDASAPTVIGTVLGSLPYMPPEQASGEVRDLDPRADIYALGAVLYHLLTLQPPFAGEESDLLARVRAGRVPPPGQVLGAKKLPHLPGGRLPESLAAVALKAMAGRPEDRYQSVPELQRELESYQSGFATSAENAGAWKLATLFFRRHRTVSIAVALGLLGSAFFAHRMVRAHDRAEAARLRADEQRDGAEEHSYVAHLLDAGRHLADGYPEKARELLLSHRREKSGRDLRGWEWFYLHGQLHQDRLQVTAHTGGVLALAARADGQMLATGGADGEVALWRPRGLVPEARFPAHRGRVQAVAWHPAGLLLASGGADGRVCVWQAATRQLVAEMHTAGGGPVRALCWQPQDGGSPRLAVGGEKPGLSFWRPLDKGSPASLETRPDNVEVSALHWAADGTKLAYATFETGKGIRVEDFSAGGRRFERDPPSGNDVFSIALNPSGRLVAAGTKNLQLAVYDHATGEQIFGALAHRGPVSALAWSPDGRLLASASHDRAIRLHEPRAGRTMRRIFTGHTGEINALAWTRGAGEGTLFSGGADGTLRAWAAVRLEEEALAGRTDNWIAAARWSPDARRLAVACFHPYVEVFAAAFDRPVRWPVRTEVFDVEWARSGDRLAVAERYAPVPGRPAGAVEVLDGVSGAVVAELPWAGVNRVAWSPGDTHLAAASPAGVAVWAMPGGAVVSTIPRPAGSVAWAADGRRIALGAEDGAIEIWDARTGRIIATWRAAPPAQTGAISSRHEPPRQVFDLAWSPDGQWLAFVTQDSVAGLLRARDGQLGRSFTGHGGGIWRVDWSPDSRRIATCGLDGSLFVFDAQSGDQVAQLLRGTSRQELHAVDWSPDGRQLLAGGYDRNLYVWDARGGDLMDAAEQWEHRVRLSPQDAGRWRELAAACTRLGWATRARAAFDRAQELAPKDATLPAAKADAEVEFVRATEAE